MSKVKVSKSELETLLFYAFRYALGRQTYAVFDVAELVSLYHEHLPKKTIDKIIDEIEAAIKNGQAGSKSIDVPLWQELALELHEHG